MKGCSFDEMVYMFAFLFSFFWSKASVISILFLSHVVLGQ